MLVRSISVATVFGIALLLTGCDTMDDGSDYSSSGDNSYSAPSSQADDSSPTYTTSADSSSTPGYDYQAAQDQAEQQRADSAAENERNYEQTQNDLNEADQYHYNND